MTNTTRFRYLGVTDECVECQCCGKTGLRSTVVLELLDEDGNGGEVTYYGSSCAARALNVRGGGRAVLQAARHAHDRTLDEGRNAARILRQYGTDDHGNYPTRGLFERAVTADYQANWDKTYALRYTGRADWAQALAGHLAHWAGQLAQARHLDPSI